MGNAALYSRPFHPVTRLVASGSNFIAESAVVKNATFSSRQDLLIRMLLEDFLFKQHTATCKKMNNFTVEICLEMQFTNIN
jgi:hypothetical protein